MAGPHTDQPKGVTTPGMASPTFAVLQYCPGADSVWYRLRASLVMGLPCRAMSLRKRIRPIFCDAESQYYKGAAS
ncbi:hypothetical protein GCM10009547_39660 [Sporichthya brevicatena]|uniref:Uncharacterized protein n=1 Tax=Sporichthya brevicatena TaxID=171442 RepID=A0ABN1H7Z1_9ACTN